jgi:hypothetical protein
MSSSSVNLTMSKNFCKCHNVPQVQQKIKEKKNTKIEIGSRDLSYSMMNKVNNYFYIIEKC